MLSAFCLVMLIMILRAGGVRAELGHRSLRDARLNRGVGTRHSARANGINTSLIWREALFHTGPGRARHTLHTP